MECSFVVFIFTAETVSPFEGKQALNDHHHHKQHLILLVAAMTNKQNQLTHFLFPNYRI